MITNFEETTYELTEQEQRIVPDICEGFRKYTKDNPIKSDEIVSRINANKERLGITFTMTGVRLRKICNYIRTQGMIPLIATSNGYYVDYSEDALILQIRSLKERASSIMRCAVGLEKILNEDVLKQPQTH